MMSHSKSWQLRLAADIHGIELGHPLDTHADREIQMQIPGMEMAAGKHLRFGSRALQILADCVVNTGDGVATATSPPEAGPRT